MKKIILDTSVCIDLYNGQLLETALQLPYQFVLPDVIMAELDEPDGDTLQKLGFVVEGTSGKEIQLLSSLRNEYLKPSFNDLLSLLLAKRNSCYLITGDNALRNAARHEGVMAHGLLWLLDEMVLSGSLSEPQASSALKMIVAKGSWLPKKECDDRFKKWCK